MALPSLTGWQTEAIRVTFFASEPVNAQRNKWWETATGTPPENISEKPNSAEYSESGTHLDNFFLEMKITFNRVDWVLYPRAIASSEPPSLGSTQEALHFLIPQIEKWLESTSQPWIRAAYGHTGMLKTENIQEANAALQKYINCSFPEPQKASDLLIQINYQRDSTTSPGLTINRIGKLAGAAAQFFTLGTSPMPTTKELTFLRMELDLSSAAERSTPIDPKLIPHVLREMVSQSEEIFTVGMLP
ncbi:hypothetical protein [Pseudomonas sp. ML96]|uniref:hypothetical protein n=1 Tax=Pseudomonas sp. ML96 TaxID=1523503 RepID=UPI0012E06CF2|nr:hypothetical protein [Pseudomonas sp. ML96]